MDKIFKCMMATMWCHRKGGLAGLCVSLILTVPLGVHWWPKMYQGWMITCYLPREHVQPFLRSLADRLQSWQKKKSAFVPPPWRLYYPLPSGSEVRCYYLRPVAVGGADVQGCGKEWWEGLTRYLLFRYYFDIGVSEYRESLRSSQARQDTEIGMDISLIQLKIVLLKEREWENLAGRDVGDWERQLRETLGDTNLPLKIRKMGLQTVGLVFAKDAISSSESEVSKRLPEDYPRRFLTLLAFVFVCTFFGILLSILWA